MIGKKPMARKPKLDPVEIARRTLAGEGPKQKIEFSENDTRSELQDNLNALAEKTASERAKRLEDQEFLEERPKQRGVLPNVWEQAAKLLSVENQNAAATPTAFSIQDIDWEPGDDDPTRNTHSIVNTPRSRGASRDQSVRFQKYQFRLFAGAGRYSGRNAGRDPNKYIGQPRWTDGSGSSSSLAPDRSVSLAAVAQSMPKAFTVGVLSTSLDFADVPREQTPETSWIFDEERFKDFIVRKIPQKALDEYERDPDGIGLVRLFGSALKAYFNLYNFFLIGQSDKGFVDDNDFEAIQYFWSSNDARRIARSRLVAEGLDRYGVPPEGKPASDDYDPERTKQAWPIFRNKMIPQALTGLDRHLADYGFLTNPKRK